MKPLLYSPSKGYRLTMAAKENLICTAKALAIVLGGYVAMNAFFALILLIGYVTH